MRYFITTDGAWFPPTSAEKIHQSVTSSLRRLWTNYAIDYSGFNIRSVAINAQPGTSLEQAISMVQNDRDLNAEQVLRNTRIFVSEYAISDDQDDSDNEEFKLLVALARGEQSSWGPGRNRVHANISHAPSSERLKIEAAIFDIFHDIMIANSAIITELRRRHTKSMGDTRSFFDLKVEYALQQIANNGHPILYPNYSPNRYASFSSLSRKGVDTGPLGLNLGNVAELWDQFANNYLSDHFLTPSEACEFVRRSYFRRSSIGGRDQQGQNVSKRTKFSSLGTEELMNLFDNQQIVDRPGSFILMARTRQPTSGQVDQVGALMGWKREKKKIVKDLKLIKPKEYHNYSALAAQGALTPIRLFLKPREA